MDPFSLIIGAVFGVAVTFTVMTLIKKPQGDSSTRESLAAANATIAGLNQQIADAVRERQAREERDRLAAEEQSKILQQLAPVQDRVNKMQASLEEIEKERLAQFKTIEEQLRSTAEQQKNLGDNTKVIASALSNKQTRGQWGELTLRRLLENTGMLPHVDFFEQQKSVNDKGDGIKPDCIIRYADGKFVAVDSKVPFDDYQRANEISEVASEADERKRKDLMKAHVAAVKKHIDDISGKNYYSGLESSPEFTVMFLPSEGLLAATLDADPTILNYGFSKQVALVSPVSIYSVLRTIHYGWRQSAQEQTIKEVIDLGATLHKYVRVVAEHATSLGKSLQSSIGHYNAFASSLERNLLTATRRLNDKSLGLLDGGKPVPPVAELSESVDNFSKQELTQPEPGAEGDSN